MERIILHDGIYVYIKNGSIANADEYISILEDRYKSESNLFGGRVHVYATGLNGDGVGLTIDGINIIDIKEGKITSNNVSYTYGKRSSDLSFPQVTAYLNQIEHLGVDTFLDNYKKNLEDFKAQMNEMATALENELKENEDSGKAQLLQKVKNLILNIIIILFSLSINMNAGLDNDRYEDAYEAVIAQCITD
jgi:hypothetical protein